MVFSHLIVPCRDWFVLNHGVIAFLIQVFFAFCFLLVLILCAFSLPLLHSIFVFYFFSSSLFILIVDILYIYYVKCYSLLFFAYLKLVSDNSSTLFKICCLFQLSVLAQCVSFVAISMVCFEFGVTKFVSLAHVLCRSSLVNVLGHLCI